MGFMIMIMLSQFAGGFAAMGFTWLGAFDLPDDMLQMLAPANPITGSAFLFVSVILMVKGKHTADGRGGVYAAICVVVTLLCVISGTNKLGACFNPAVATGLTTYSIIRITPLLDEATPSASNYFLYAYLWCYMVGPWIGGALAGLFHMFHRTHHEDEILEHQTTNTHGMHTDHAEGLLNKNNDRAPTTLIN